MEFNSADISAFKHVWVFCEQRLGAMMSTTFELMSEGRKLADELGVELCGVLLGVAAAVIGCGKKRESASGGSAESSSRNPYEKMVQDFCTSAQQFSSALRTCDKSLLREFNLQDCASALQGTSSRTKPASASDVFWSALIEEKKPVKTKIIKTVDLKDMDVKGAFIAATCGDVTIYFGVGREEEREVMAVIDKKEMEEKINEIEKIEKMDGKKSRRLQQNTVKTARVETVREFINNVEVALKAYYLRCGKYPDLLDALTQASDEDGEPLLESEPVDPWGNELRYEKRGKKRPVIISAGPDGEFGTDDDITNLDARKDSYRPREDIERKVERAKEAISEKEEYKAKDAVKSIDENTIKRLGE